MNVVAFTPGTTKTLTPSASSVTASWTGGDIQSESCVVQNTGATLAFIKFTVGASTASASDFPIAAGAIMTLCKGNADTINVYSTAGTTVYATAGIGQ